MIKKVWINKKKKPAEKIPARITNDTVAEHRERVLAGGRKHKYPLQYTRNKLVRNTIIISVGGILALMAALWVQLYVVKDTSDLAYRITRALPLPIAKIDGQYVQYSEYLLYHRSTMAVLDAQGGNANNTTTASDRVTFQKKQALERAIEAAYVRKLAKESNIKISDDQVDELIEQQRVERGLSEEAYNAAIVDGLKWSMDEARQSVRNALLRREVAFKLDTEAAKTAQDVNNALLANDNIEEVAQQFGDKVTFKQSIIVPKDNSDGGLSSAASKVEVGSISGSIKTSKGDGYYFVKRHEDEGDQLKYSYIMVPLKALANDLKSALDSDKTKYFIKIN